MSKPEEVQVKNGNGNGRLLDMLNTPVHTKITRGALWGCGTLLALSLLKDAGVKFSPETTGWLLVFVQTMAGYMSQDKQ